MSWKEVRVTGPGGPPPAFKCDYCGREFEGRKAKRDAVKHARACKLKGKTSK